MIAITWFYGVTKLSKNIKQMTGKVPSLYFRSCWVVVAPSLLFVSSIEVILLSKDFIFVLTNKHCDFRLYGYLV